MISHFAAAEARLAASPGPNLAPCAPRGRAFASPQRAAVTRACRQRPMLCQVRSCGRAPPNPEDCPAPQATSHRMSATPSITCRPPAATAPAAMERRPPPPPPPPSPPPASLACCCRRARRGRGTRRAWARRWFATTWGTTSSAGSCGTLAAPPPASRWTTSSPPPAPSVGTRAEQGHGGAWLVDGWAVVSPVLSPVCVGCWQALECTLPGPAVPPACRPRGVV